MKSFYELLLPSQPDTPKNQGDTRNSDQCLKAVDEGLPVVKRDKFVGFLSQEED